MDLRNAFCHNADCGAYGQPAAGNIRIHSRREARYRCITCGKTFAASADTPLYRAHVAAATIALVLTLLAYGCPIPAIVAAFGFDERTVRRWLTRTGPHLERFHQRFVGQAAVDLGVVQADELWVKAVGRRLWVAMAIAVPSRFWLGGCLSESRDKRLIRQLVAQVRAAAATLAVVVCVDGLGAYVEAFRRAFRQPLRTSPRGRPRLVPAPGFGLGQVVKRRVGKVVVEVTQRAKVGRLERLTAALSAVGAGTKLNTAYIERLNATFRSRMAPLVRRSRRLARTDSTLSAWLYLVGCTYNFSQYHASLRLPLPSTGERLWQPQTPAMAAGLTDHRWTMEEILRLALPPPRFFYWEREIPRVTVVKMYATPHWMLYPA